MIHPSSDAMLHAAVRAGDKEQCSTELIITSVLSSALRLSNFDPESATAGSVRRGAHT